MSEEKWHSVAEMSELTEIPQQTLRRYMNNHKHLLQMKKQHRNYLISEESHEPLKKMRELYQRGWTTDQVNEEMATSGIPITIDYEDESSGEQVRIPASEVFSDIKKALEKQGEFNEKMEMNQEKMLEMFRAMSEKLDEQQRIIVEQQRIIQESLEKKDQQQLIELEEEKEEEPKKSSWFKKLFK